MHLNRLCCLFPLNAATLAPIVISDSGKHNVPQGSLRIKSNDATILNQAKQKQTKQAVRKKPNIQTSKIYQKRDFKKANSQKRAY